MVDEHQQDGHHYHGDENHAEASPRSPASPARWPKPTRNRPARTSKTFHRRRAASSRPGALVMPRQTIPVVARAVPWGVQNSTRRIVGHRRRTSGKRAQRDVVEHGSDRGAGSRVADTKATSPPIKPGDAPIIQSHWSRPPAFGAGWPLPALLRSAPLPLVGQRFSLADLTVKFVYRVRPSAKPRQPDSNTMSHPVAGDCCRLARGEDLTLSPAPLGIRGIVWHRPIIPQGVSRGQGGT